MKALVLEDYNTFRLRDWVKPIPGRDEVLINVKACAICGSDVHGADGSTGRRIPPIIMGHEASGIIEAVGSDVLGFEAGDRVTFDSTVYCGTCEYCRSGKLNLCFNRRVLGVSCDDYMQHGAMAEYVVVPRNIVYRLPDEVSFSSAAMVEPLAIALHALRASTFQLNKSVVIIGAGTIGLLLIQLLQAAGANPIIAVDLEKVKLDAAKGFGADICLNADTDDVSNKVFQATGGKGADVIFEAVGISQTVQTAFNCVRKGGGITLIGNISPRVELPLQRAVTQELSIFGSCASAGEYDACLNLISNKTVDVDSLITAEVPLSQGADWFHRLLAKETGLLKVILLP